MATMTFRTAQAHTVWHSMAEGMLEVRQDDNDSRAPLFERLIEQTPASGNDVYPRRFVIPGFAVQIARDILENCMDNSSGMQPDDSDAADHIFEGDVTIDAPIEPTTREAVGIAIETLQEYASGNASPLLLAAIESLEGLLAQQGCESWGNEGIAGLCELCDLIIYG
jgi:hypothetical protein